MKISEVITKLQEIVKKEGDLDILMTDEYPLFYIDCEESDGEYPESYNMPKGYRFVRMNSIE